MTEPPLPREPEPEAMDLDEEAAAYAQADFADVNEAFVARLLELATRMDAARTLDLGTGPADIPLRAARERPQWRFIAADVSGPMLRFAWNAALQAARTQQIALVQTDAKRLPFAEHAFDIVFSNSILHHVANAETLWSEVKRVARPGALIFFRDLARPDTEAEAAAIVARYAATESKLLQEEYYRSLLSAYTIAEVRRQLDRAGLAHFQVAKVTDRHLDVTGLRP